MSKTATAKTAPDVEFGDTPDLVSTYRDADFVETAEDEPLEDDGWDGKFTPIKLAFGPVMRDLYTLWPGDRCIGHAARRVDGVHQGQRVECPLRTPDGKATRDHQFHIAASKGPDGKYRGPEADHLRRLIGWVEHERAAPTEEEKLSGQRGAIVKTHVHGGYVAGTKVAQARAEQYQAMMAQRGTDQSILTKAQHVAMIHSANADRAPAELLAMEEGERRDEAKKLVAANQDMLKELIPGIAAAVATAVAQATAPKEKE